MLKKTITYEDYNGQSRTEDFYFNLTKTEVTELEISEDGGLRELIIKVTQEENPREIFRIFKKVVLASYGEKSPDGKYFLKEDNDGHRLSSKFAQSEAFNVLVMSFFENVDTATAFVNGILPSTK